MLSKDELRHNSKVRELEKEFTERGYFCQTFIPYKTEREEGEIDLFVIQDTLPPRYTFYEIKCHGSRRKKKKAKEQYQRFLNCYGLTKREVQGYMISLNKGTRRL